MSVLPYYTDMPVKIKQKARAALERELMLKLDKTNADAVIEQVWNALVGHDRDQSK